VYKRQPYSQIDSVGLTSAYTDTGLYGGGTTYYYVVTAVDKGNNESGNSNQASATPTDGPPSAPTGLLATPGDKQVSLDWADNIESDLAGYNIHRSQTDGGPYSQIDSVGLTSAYTDTTGLTGGTTYYYVVTAVDSGTNESGNSNQASATPTDAPPAAPTGLLATPGDKQVDLDWDDNSEGDLAGYNIHRSQTDGGPYSQIDSVGLTSAYTDTTGLTGGTTYYYVVTAVDSGTNESGNSNQASATPTDAPPAAPTGLLATPGDKQVSLDWNDNGEGDLAGYNIHRSQTDGGPYSQIDSVGLTSAYTDTGLTGGTTYYYVVTAVDSGTNESGYSNQASATPTDLPPAAPTNLAATPGDTEVDLDWNDNGEGDLAGYNIHRSETDGGPYSQIDSVGLTSAYTDTGLTNGTTYYYVVTAVDTGTNESGYSNQASATPTDLPPAAPTNLGATLGDTEVSLDWDDNGEGDLAGYNIHRSQTDGGPYSQIDSVGLTSAYTDTGLTNGTTYYYVVTAVDSGTNESGNSNQASATPTDLPPAAPTNLAATPGDTEVSLDWDDSGEGDLAGYNIHRSQTDGGPYSQIDSVGLTSAYTDTGLTNGTTYYYVVTAVDTGTNESGNSNQASATPADAPPAAPTNLAATPGDKQVDLDWDDNSEGDLAGYNIHRSQTDGGPYSQIDSVGLTSAYTDTGLTGGTTYYYVVTAVDTGTNESGNSNQASATPADPPPAAPTGLLATPGDKQVSLDWDDNSEGDLAGYNIHRSQTDGGPYSQIDSVGLTSAYTDTTGLTGGTTYYYVVTAVDTGTNESGNSNQASAMPTDAPPAAPTGLGATPGDKQVDLDWDDNSEGDLAGYNVHRSETDGGPYSQIDSVGLTSDYTDTGLTGGVTYYYVVTAVDTGTNESGNSNQASAMPTDLPPAAPTGLLATPGDKQVSLDWNDNGEGDLAGYNIHRSQTDGGPYSQIDSVGLTSAYTDTGLTNGTTYYYVVTAVDTGTNESGNSNQASATPAGIPLTLLDDGFEGTPWDANWDGNGTTDWQLSGSGSGYSGNFSAEHSSGDTYLTSDNLDASGADNITVSFWFKIKDLNKGPLYIQLYNGTTYNNWYDLTTYPGVVKNVWIQFSQNTTDSQYFISNFGLRFDGSGETTNSFIDDVLVKTNQ